MSRRSSFSHLQKARGEITHRRNSMGSIRKDFRNKFMARVKFARSKSVDRFRQIVEDQEDNSYKSLHNIRKNILQEKKAVDALTVEANELIDEIQKDVAQINLGQEEELYMNQWEQGPENIIDRHVTLCNVCEKPVKQGNICAICSDQFHSDFD